MNIRQIMVFFIFLAINSVSFAKDKEELIDGRSLSIRDRVKLMTQYRISERNKAVPVEDQSRQFIDNLKESGAKGVDESKSLVVGMDQNLINQEQGKAPDDTYDKLKGALSADGGKIKEYRQVNYEEKVNGKLKIIDYVIEYENGNKQRVQFQYIQPDISGGFKLMEVKVLE
jgi:hypothetical protein